MCNFIAILIYGGLVEAVSLFDNEVDAREWLLSRINEINGKGNCDGSIIWDAKKRIPIEFEMNNS